MAGPRRLLRRFVRLAAVAGLVAAAREALLARNDARFGPGASERPR